MDELNYKEIAIEAGILQEVPEKIAWEYGIIPFLHETTSISLWVKEGRDFNELQTELEFLLGKDIILESQSEEFINYLLLKYYRKNENNNSIDTQLSSYSDDFLTKLIEEAQNHNSSDIHIEIFEKKARIRVRVDGKLKEIFVINKFEYPSILNKIKIKANLDISEKRLPQDGRIIFENKSGSSTDIRVSILPTLYGEKAVLRLLKKDVTDINLNSLGFSKVQLEDYITGTRKSNGIILISGPTGSGKTTTLYATLKILNKEGTNVLTIEDPIEYTLEGVNQVQLKENIGLSFSSALRTFLRQDPDIIMLGEIRDAETAQMAIRAALTGHLVLSTIHTNSAWGTVGRLIDMGVPPFLISATLNLSVAQRLVRLLCDHCKLKIPTAPEELPFIPKGFSLPHFHYTPNGCEKCYHTGYNGRKAIYEVIPMDQELKSLIKKNELNVNSKLNEKGISFLSHQAFELFYQGKTTYEEVVPILLSNSD